MNSSNKLSLLVVSNAYPKSTDNYFGIFVKNQVREFKNKGDVEVKCCCSTRRVHSLFSKLKKYFLLALRFIPELFYSYDVIHVHFPFPALFLAYLYRLFHPKVKVVVTFHGSGIRNYPKNIAEKLLGLGFDKFVDQAIAVSQELAETIGRRLNPGVPIKTLSAGLDFEKFSPEARDKSKDFLYVGSFKEIKGVDLFIESIGDLDKEVKALAVGRGNLEQSIPSCIEIHEPVEQSRLIEFYNAAKLVVVPSRQEAFGLVACEALACGTPVVAARVGGLKEFVCPGENGLFFEPGNINSLKKKLREGLILYEESKFLEPQEIRATVKKYSLENVVETQLRIYKNLLNSGSAH